VVIAAGIGAAIIVPKFLDGGGGTSATSTDTTGSDVSTNTGLPITPVGPSAGIMPTTISTGPTPTTTNIPDLTTTNALLQQITKNQDLILGKERDKTTTTKTPTGPLTTPTTVPTSMKTPTPVASAPTPAPAH